MTRCPALATRDAPREGPEELVSNWPEKGSPASRARAGGGAFVRQHSDANRQWPRHRDSRDRLPTRPTAPTGGSTKKPPHHDPTKAAPKKPFVPSALASITSDAAGVTPMRRYRATCSSHGQDGRPRQAKPRAASRFHLGAPQTGAARFAAHKEAGRDQKQSVGPRPTCGRMQQGRWRAALSRDPDARRRRSHDKLTLARWAALGSVKWSEFDF
jgi:hypothetical protein